MIAIVSSNVESDAFMSVIYLLLLSLSSAWSIDQTHPTQLPANTPLEEQIIPFDSERRWDPYDGLVPGYSLTCHAWLTTAL